MDFSLIDYLDEDACYAQLVELLHPDGLACPGCGERERLGVHRRRRAPVLDYQCAACGRVFNAWAGTFLQGTHRRPSHLLSILRRVARGDPRRRWPASWGATAAGCWACGTGCRTTPPTGWTAIRRATPWSRPTRPPSTRGKKGLAPDDPDDPPRRRANARRGHGTFATDRPPVAGVVGRESGEVRLEVIDTARAATLEGLIDDECLEETTIHTDEWNGYNRRGRLRKWAPPPVDPSGPQSTWAVDEDGDGVREVHCNTREGLWTGLRNFLRPFRGVSKWYLHQ